MKSIHATACVAFWEVVVSDSLEMRFELRPFTHCFSPPFSLYPKN